MRGFIMNIKVNPGLLSDIKQTLEGQGKSAVRFDLAGFG
jgi:hypothetical protein